MNMIPGIYTLQGCSNVNKKPLIFAEYQNWPSSKSDKKLFVDEKKTNEDGVNDQEYKQQLRIVEIMIEKF